MRYLIPVLLAVVLAAPASAQTLLQATFSSNAGDAITNDIKGTPYVTTARINGYSNEVGLTSSGTLYFRVLKPEVLGRTINVDFSKRVGDPPEKAACRRFNATVDQFTCALPSFLTQQALPSPNVIFSWISTTYEWEYKTVWVPKELPDRKGNLQPVLLDFNAPGTWTRYAVLNWQLRLDEGSGDPYTYWPVFSNTWENALNESGNRVGIVAVTRVDDTTWKVRPIDPSTEGGLPTGLQEDQALLTQYVLADLDSCVSGVGGHCYVGDFLMPFELTLTKVPKTRR